MGKTPNEESSRNSEYADLLKQYRLKSGTGVTGGKPMRLDEDSFVSHRKQNIRIFAYTNRLMTQLLMHMKESPAVFALFDGDGCLLKLHGQERSVAALRANGIDRKTLWTLDIMGANAVTLGLAKGTTLSSEGEENDSPLLKNYALYFSPVIVVDDRVKDGNLHLYGGLSVIVPLEQSNPDYRLTAFAAANDLGLHIVTGNTYYKLYENSVDALLVFDINMQNGRVTTLYHSNSIFEVLAVDAVDIYFRPAEELVDPLPANRDFWAIIDEQRRVYNETLVLTVKGKERTCVITTAPYYQPYLNAKGITFLITTPQRVSAHISQKMGDTAVLTFDNIVGHSPGIRTAIQKGKILANSDSNMILLGESGVGKDVFAQAIHNTGRRQNKPFIAVNCGALPRELIASELFGYEGGAFTGAKRQGNIGKFELANGGTLFLDEVGELPLDLQATLLRAVEQKRITRLGGTQEIDIDVRIISATNINIPAMVEQKRFRSDLYYRLSTLSLQIPPLRERGEDILLLAEYFIRKISKRIRRPEPIELSEEAKQLLLTLPWRGNVRELQNLMEGIVQLYPDLIIMPNHITENMDFPYIAADHAPLQAAASPAPSEGHNKRKPLTEKEIRDALEVCNGNRSEAARYLGIGRRTLYSNMERLGI